MFVITFIKKRIIRGNILWRFYNLPKQFRKKRFALFTDYIKYLGLIFSKYTINSNDFNNMQYNNCVTIVITSCGRKEYLIKTIESLKRNFIYDADKTWWYIIEDYPASVETTNYIDTLTGFDLKVINKKNYGLGYSLNRIYSKVFTEFVFHCEDDWVFLHPIPVSDMIKVMKEKKYLRQLLLNRMPIVKGDKNYRNVKNIKEKYAEFDRIYSFNPHLARTILFYKVRPIPMNNPETEYTLKMEKQGFKVSGIYGYNERYYVKHIGHEKMSSPK